MNEVIKIFIFYEFDSIIQYSSVLKERIRLLSIKCPQKQQFTTGFKNVIADEGDSVKNFMTINQKML